jgi:hypothetical protein
MCVPTGIAINSPFLVRSQMLLWLNISRRSLSETRLIVGGIGLEWSGMVTVSEIRERLVDLLAAYDEDSLASFEEWLASASWNMSLGSDFSASGLVGDIQLYIAEADNETLEWIKKKLELVLESSPFFSPNLTSPQIITGSSIDLTDQKVWAFSSVDKLLATACS